MNKQVLSMAIVMALQLAAFNGFAAGNNGSVTFNGEVVDSPCDLAPGQDGTDVKVPFGQLSMEQLNSGQVKSQNFQLQLKNCNLAGKTTSITFNGINNIDTTMLATTGSATGVGIALSSTNAPITLGTPFALNGLSDGSNTLAFTATAKKAASGTSVTAGDFTAVSNFTIAYQ